MKSAITIDFASVKVMRSHDYCHFEVSLSTSLDGIGPEHHANTVDELRKTAARLADKAVDQYKIAKVVAGQSESVKQNLRLEAALKTPESERSPTEKAIVKYHQDAAFRSRFDYDYEDDYEPLDASDL
jgi:hypothetical protein